MGCAVTQKIEPIEHTQTTEQSGVVKDKVIPDSSTTETIEEPLAEITAAPLEEEPVTFEAAANTTIPTENDDNFLESDSSNQEFGLAEQHIVIETPSDDSENKPSEEPDVLIEKPIATPIAVELTEKTEPIANPIEPNAAPIEQETVVGHSLPTPETENERTFMPLLLYLFILVSIVTIVLIILIRKIGTLKQHLEAEQRRIREFGIADMESAQEKKQELGNAIARIESQLVLLKGEWVNLKGAKGSLEENCNKLEKRVENQKQKLVRIKELYSAIEHAIERFHNTEIPPVYYRPLTDQEKVDLDSIAPSVILNLNYMNYQELRKEFRANQKQIEELLDDYSQRYTTKANQAIYKLMVISLRSELQNILYNLKHEKLDNALFQVQSLIAKYLVIASDGNQSIVGTMRRFVGELEHLFDNAVRIEYEYYIKKEQARQEQLALRQQMREEAEERKRLEEQKKQIAFEESKYKAEIEKVQEQLNLEPEDSAKRIEIIAKLEELNTHLEQVEEKKDEITKLQNGKAGNVYIISNLGSFGDHVFKVGMTRRLDPQDRVNELGDASVPFKFDVHSFIFSEDAVGLENELHKRLHARRLNKVNLRKEFFDISLDELEQLVQEINPTAEFNRTMLAEDYNISLSMGDQELPPSEFNQVLEGQEDEEPDEYS